MVSWLTGFVVGVAGGVGASALTVGVVILCVVVAQRVRGQK